MIKLIFNILCYTYLLGLLSCHDAIAFNVSNASEVHAYSPYSLDLQNANLSEVIQLLAKLLRVNVIVSPSVSGKVTLHLHNARHTEVLDMLLATHGLGKLRMDNVMYIAPREELIKQKQDELRWRTIRQESARLIAKVWQIKYAKAEDIAYLIQNEHASLLSKRGQISLDKRTNTLYIQDVEEQMRALYTLIERLDVPVKQISIAARLVSIDSDCERELGLNFLNRARIPNEGAQLAVTPESLGSYSLAVAKLADGSLLDVKLAALENAGHAELLSSPSLFTANQQPASIEAGEEVPYQELNPNGGTAIVFKKAVLGLKVTPQILPGGKVLLVLQINQDRPSNRTILGMPTISTHQIMTNVLVANGETIVLGGIYETNAENLQQRVPFLSRIPLLGSLFIKQHSRQNKRELLIFVTPSIITSKR